MNKRYVAIEVGCIECQEDTHVLGVYDSREKAEAKHEERPPYVVIREAP